MQPQNFTVFFPFMPNAPLTYCFKQTVRWKPVWIQTHTFGTLKRDENETEKNLMHHTFFQFLPSFWLCITTPSWQTIYRLSAFAIGFFFSSVFFPPFDGGILIWQRHTFILITKHNLLAMRMFAFSLKFLCFFLDSIFYLGNRLRFNTMKIGLSHFVNRSGLEVHS